MAAQDRDLFATVVAGDKVTGTRGKAGQRWRGMESARLRARDRSLPALGCAR